jgi:hypothetical protein
LPFVHLELHAQSLVPYFDHLHLQVLLLIG